MAQDELGHSRALLPLLKDFPHVDPGIPEEAPRQQYSALAFLEQPFASWPTFVAANILIGESLTVAVEAARNSIYVPLRTRAVKILEEERFHWLHGEGWFKRLAVHDKEGVGLAEKVEQILPESLAWLGLPDEAVLDREGILDAPPDELRTRLMDRVGPLIAKSAADHLVGSEGGHWFYNGVIPWNRYDPATRRLRRVEAV
jgi:ring-1,2-phenylacetyl-CoA epoxidase subunit PaaA/ring-1,2-phenylacetyl-CoA epoxidase subunit PaaC